MEIWYGKYWQTLLEHGHGDQAQLGRDEGYTVEQNEEKNRTILSHHVFLAIQDGQGGGQT
jgi:hypothetical protein